MRARLTWTAIVVALTLAAGAAVWLVRRNVEADMHYHAALDALKRRDFRVAEQHLSKYLQIKPKDIDARLQAAQAARLNDDFETADRHLEAYQSEGGSAFRLAMEKRLRKVQLGEDIDDAEELQAYWEDDPQDRERLRILEAVIAGKLLFLERTRDAGDVPPSLVASTEGIIGAWSRSCTGEADQVESIVWQGRLLLVKDENVRAAAVLKEVLERCPDHYSARLYLAVALAPEAPNESLPHLEILRRRKPNDGRVAVLLSSIRRGRGELGEARQILDEVLRDNPEYLPALFGRGVVALEAEQARDAEPFLQKALTLAPQHSGIHLALARCLHLQGKTDKAKEHQEVYRRLEAERLKTRQEKINNGTFSLPLQNDRK